MFNFVSLEWLIRLSSSAVLDQHQDGTLPSRICVFSVIYEVFIPLLLGYVSPLAVFAFTPSALLAVFILSKAH